MSSSYRECPECGHRRVRVSRRYHKKGIFRCDNCGLSGLSVEELEEEASVNPGSYYNTGRRWARDEAGRNLPTVAETDRKLMAEGFDSLSVYEKELLAEKSRIAHLKSPIGTGRPFGARDLSDDSIERLIRKNRRLLLEDVADGLEPEAAAAGARQELAELEEEANVREALRFSWKAREDGTDHIVEFDRAGGLAALVRGEAGEGVPPSYWLAILLDYRHHLRGRPTALVWPEQEAAEETGKERRIVHDDPQACTTRTRRLQPSSSKRERKEAR